MNSDNSQRWQKIGTGILILVGLILAVRLGLIAMAGFRSDKPQSIEEVRDLLKASAIKEREDWERRWRESGHPPPTGGFDAAWKAARGLVSEEETLPSMDTEPLHDQQP